MISEQYTITSTRQKIIIAAPIERTVYIHCLSTGTVYLGGSNVTAANGMLTEKNAVPFELLLPAHQELWAISGDGAEDLRLLRTSADGN